jgi:UDP-glucose 4-epimerase
MPERPGKILVTGGAGYIGSHAIISLIENGFSVVSVDNFSNSFESTIHRIEEITGANIRNYNMNLRQEGFIDIVFRDNPDITAVMHFAASKSVPESIESPELYYRNNLFPLINILSCMKEFGCKNIVFSSSCSVYGNSKVLPVNELTPIGTSESPYGFTKLKCEEIISDFISNDKDFKAISLRYFNPAGAHPSGKIGEKSRKPINNLFPAITKAVFEKEGMITIHGNDYGTRDGTCIRDYVHVCDIADAHVLALKQLDKSNGGTHEVFNLGTGEGVTVMEAIMAFEEATGKKVPYNIGKRRDGDIQEIYSDSSKSENILGWKPKYGIKEMMASAWKWEKARTKLAVEKE